MSGQRRHSSTSSGSSVSIRRGSKQSAIPTSASVQCVALGDGDVGKSTMLLTFLCGRCPSDLSPGPMDGHSEFAHVTQAPYTLTLESSKINLSLVDTYGQDEYEKLRERQCASADVFILCYDVSKPESFERIRHHWLPEIHRYGIPETPFIIAGLKSELRTPNSEASMPYTQALKDAEDLGAAHYVECTAFKNPIGVRRVVEKAAMTAITMGRSGDELKRVSCTLS